MSGSAVALLTRVEPDIVRSVHGEMSHAHAGNSSCASRNRLINARVRLAPALSPPIAMSAAAIPWFRKNRHQSARRRTLLGTDARVRADTRVRGCAFSLPGPLRSPNDD